MGDFMKKKKMKLMVFLVVVLTFSFNTIYSSMFFFDVIGHWAEEEIFWATNDYELFKGYEDGSFKPDNYITRGEYISILYRTAVINKIIKEEPLKPKEETKKDTKEEKKEEVKKVIVKQIGPYIDLKESYWGYKNIAAMYKFINSNSGIKFEDIFVGNTFDANKYITRNEAALLISIFDYPAVEEKGLVFKDVLPSYKYYNEIMNLVNNEIINGYADNTFKPQKNITRAESAKLIKRLFKEIGYGKGFIKNMLLVTGIYDSKFMYFGNYFGNDKLKEDDKKYVKALRTLEYLDFIVTIPYDEKKNYDDNPLKTLISLKDEGYWNNIGLNYYLIKYDLVNDEVIQQFINEMIKEYETRDDLKGCEVKSIFNQLFIKSKNPELLDKVFKKWEVSAQDKEYYNVIFTRAIYLCNNNRSQDALDMINNLLYNDKSKTTDPEILRTIYLNKTWIEYKLGKLNQSVKTLEELLKIIRFYSINDPSLKKVEEDIIGYIKVIKSENLKLSINKDMKTEQ
ncbi:S-layer homology domain-containing protein [Clostridiaceae bacterium M8S5]|nr:S-layer homology domain-containing protein [Clostridiaceae bacterium M8S5]